MAWARPVQSLTVRVIVDLAPDECDPDSNGRAQPDPLKPISHASKHSERLRPRTAPSHHPTPPPRLPPRRLAGAKEDEEEKQDQRAET
jgi:hypothetical protein